MKFRFILIDEDSYVTGTNSEAVAKQAADDVGDNGYLAVIDTERGVELVGDNDYPIQNQTTFIE